MSFINLELIVFPFRETDMWLFENSIFNSSSFSKNWYIRVKNFIGIINSCCVSSPAPGFFATIFARRCPSVETAVIVLP